MTYPTAARGPLGTPRVAWQVAVLTLLTCGLYAVYWAYVSHQELKDHTGAGLGGVGGLVVFVVAGIVTMFLLPNEVENAAAARGLRSDVSARTGLWVLLPIVGWFIWQMRVQHALNALWTAP